MTKYLFILFVLTNKNLNRLFDKVYKLSGASEQALFPVYV